MWYLKLNDGVSYARTEENELLGSSEMDDSLFREAYDGTYRLKEYFSSEAYEKEKKAYEGVVEARGLKAYLAETDYVISKLNELKLEDEEGYEEAKTQYSDVLKKRKEARARINELEG